MLNTGGVEFLIKLYFKASLSKADMHLFLLENASYGTLTPFRDELDVPSTYPV